MNLNFTDLPNPGVTLGEIVESHGDISSTFIYEGWVYALLKNDHASGLSITIPSGCRAAMNLKSQTVRAINLRERVHPVEVEARIVAKRTHRYQS